MRRIEAEPNRWNQNSFLGTSAHGITMCLAGWIAHLSGLDVAATMRRDPSGRTLVAHVRTLLGIGDRAAQILFWDFGVGMDYHPSVKRLKARIVELTGVTLDDTDVDA